MIREGGACAGCRVTLDPVLVLDGRRSEQLGEPIVLGRMSDGRILLTPAFDMALIAVFDADGRFVGRLGGAGEGPGEFKAVGQIKVGPGDTATVFDHWNPRRTVFGPDLEYARSVPMDVPVGVTGLVVLPGGRLVTQRWLPIPGHADEPVHVMDSVGRILRSFGSGSVDAEPGSPTWWSLSPASEESVWVAPITRYRLDLWTVGGTLSRRLVREVLWFRPHDHFGIDYDNPDEPPNPGIVGLRTDAEGLLWVLLNVPDEDWRSGLGEVSGMRGSMWGIASPDRYYDSVVEVIDPRTNVVVASGRFDPALGNLLEDGHAVSYSETEEGYPMLRLWRLGLQR